MASHLPRACAAPLRWLTSLQAAPRHASAASARRGAATASAPASPTAAAATVRSPAAAAAAAAATTQPVQFTPRAMTEEHVRKVSEADGALRAAYDALPAAFPPHAQPTGAGAGVVDTAAAARKRLLYRSRQRGWLEVDLLMGTWAAQHLAGLDAAGLVEYERILNRETLDLYNYMTGKEAPPAELDGPVMTALIAFAASSPLGQASTAGYEKVKTTFMSN